MEPLFDCVVRQAGRFVFFRVMSLMNDDQSSRCIVSSETVTVEQDTAF